MDDITKKGLPRGITGKEPANQCRRHETQVQSLGWEDPLGEGMATPLQYSCLENPMDRGAWLPSIGSQRTGHDEGLSTAQC